MTPGKSGLARRPRGLSPGPPPFMGLLPRIMLASILLGCGGSSGGTGPGESPWDRCPSPGVGISVGGEPGGGDVARTPSRILVLMGGGSEDDLASTRFVEGAGGGDIVILRASGSLNTYPAYFTETLSPSVPPSSAVTVLTSDPAAGGDPAVSCWLTGAEALWLAGGDQWDYLGGWPAGLHARLGQLHTTGTAVGGTSAGAAALGEAAFDARFGTVTSQEALADPLKQDVSVSYPVFAAPELAGALVDSHFMDRDREGRLLAFLARFLTEKSRSEVLGIGLDEGVALVIQGGAYRVYAPLGQSAWLYEVTGPAQVEESSPLGLAGIERARLDNASEGWWPVDFSTLSTTQLRVRGGVLEIVQ